VYKIGSEGRLFALKQYFFSKDDLRDRLGAEVEALEAMRRGGLDMVPQLIGIDREHGFALMTWIYGTPVREVSSGDIDQSLAFLTRLHALAQTSAVPRSRLAAEACLSGAEIERQLNNRLQQLRSVPQSEFRLHKFIESQYVPVHQQALDRAYERVLSAELDFNDLLPKEKQSLVPADFGFHNSLRRAEGSLAFLDFEYFGWDDPVKLTSDFLFHPSTTLGDAECKRFRHGAEHLYANDLTFGARLAAYYPLFGLRWVLILLNEFLPDRWQRRLLAGETNNWPLAKERQLARADDLLKRVTGIGH
jgi:hypothetical protein